MTVSLADVSIGMASVLLSVLAFLAAGRAAKTARDTEEMRMRSEQRSVDAEAYHRAQIIYDNALDQLRRQNTDQEATIIRLSRRVTALERALHRAGLPPPIVNGEYDDKAESPGRGTTESHN